MGPMRHMGLMWRMRCSLVRNGSVVGREPRTANLLLSRSHSRIVHKSLHRIIDLASSPPMGGMNVHRLPVKIFRTSRSHRNLVFHWLIVIGDLKLRIVDAVELP